MLYLPWGYVIVTEQAGILSSGIGDAPNTLAAGDVLPILQMVFSAQAAIPLIGFALGVWAIARKPSVAGIGAADRRGRLAAGDVRAERQVRPALGSDAGVSDAAADDRVRVRAEPRCPGAVGTELVIVWLILTLALPQVIQPRLDSEAAARALATAYQPGDAVILETGWDDNAFAYEIGEALPAGAAITRTLPWTNDRTGGAPVVPEIEPVLQSHTRVWVVQLAASAAGAAVSGGRGRRLITPSKRSTYRRASTGRDSERRRLRSGCLCGRGEPFGCARQCFPAEGLIPRLAHNVAH